MKIFDAPLGACSSFASALMIACAVSCSERVNLGGPASNLPPEPNCDAGASLQPTTLYRLNEGVYGCYDIAVDDTYIYLSTGETGGSSVHRCRKEDCAATLTRVVGPCPDCEYTSIAVKQNRLGLAHGRRQGSAVTKFIAACTTPDCADLQKVAGDFPGIDSVAFDDNRVYWSLLADHTIYECGFPNCPDGPRAFSPGGASFYPLLMDADWVYWVEGGVRRKRKNGSSGVETLELGPVLGRAVDGGAGPSTQNPSAFAVDGSWLYAMSSGSNDPEIACDSAGGLPCLIARWPLGMLGGAREIIVKSSVALDFQQNAMRAFAGELVFRVEQTYSCNAATCTATTRPLGDASPARMTSDRDYLYYCTSPPFVPDAPPAFGELQRVSRICR